MRFLQKSHNSMGIKKKNPVSQTLKHEVSLLHVVGSTLGTKTTKMRCYIILKKP